MLRSKDEDKTLVEICSVSKVFLKISKFGAFMSLVITFQLIGQQRAEGDSQLVFSNPGAGFID